MPLPPLAHAVRDGARRGVRAHPTMADGLLAAAVAVLVLAPYAMVDDAFLGYPGLDAVALALGLAATLPITLRRSHTGAAFGVIIAVEVAAGIAHYPGGAGLGALVLLYTVAAHRTLRESLRWLGVTAVALVVVLSLAPGDITLGDWFSNALEFTVAYVLGRAVRNRRLYTAALTERAERAEREREVTARAAVVSERQRIARELHDVVAHNVSVIGVLVAGARRSLHRDPDQAKEALAAVERTAHETLREMRALLDVLRTDDADDPDDTDEPGHTQQPPRPDAELAPQPGVAGVEALVAQVRDAGLPVELVVDGERRPLPPGIELSAYRIVQEALTNALKHAGPARARVHVRYAAEALDVEVADDGRGVGANGWTPTSGGHGLVGMRERVSLYGGTLSTGPRTGGGYAVRAHLPLEPPA